MEYTTLVKLTNKLEIALHNDRDMTHFLHTSGLISEKTYDSVNDPRSTTLNSMEKASLLVHDIKLKVRLNPENYHVLIRYFNENEQKYKDILKILNEEYDHGLSSRGLNN